MTKDKIKASHILVMHNESRDSRSDITKEKAKKSIDQIYKNVVDGKTTFGDAAVKHSDCSSSEHGGDLGEFGRGYFNYCLWLNGRISYRNNKDTKSYEY